MTEILQIRQAEQDDLPKLTALIEALGHSKNQDYFERCFQRQEKGDLIVFLGFSGKTLVTYCLLNWVPKYPLYKKLSIPEIQDLNVHRDYRRAGVASRMISHCEALAREKGYEQIGIGVGIHGSYGPAQRLYVKLGYIPDGQGVCYDRQGINFADMRPVDDQLCLMMVKGL